MNSWFECKIKVEDPTLDKEAKGRIEGAYLVDALTYAEAEARITKEITPFCNGMLRVQDIKRAKYAELFESDSEEADKWFNVKCCFITLDEKTQTEKRTVSPMLVQASNVHDALKRFDTGMKGTMMDYAVTEIKETKIIEVFKLDQDKLSSGE